MMRASSGTIWSRILWKSSCRLEAVLCSIARSSRVCIFASRLSAILAGDGGNGGAAVHGVHP